MVNDVMYDASREVLWRYYELMDQAADASQLVDDFDVVSSDPESLAAFKALCEEDRKAQIALIRHVMAEGPAIMAKLKGEEGGDPT